MSNNPVNSQIIHEVELFIQHIDSLYESLPLTDIVISAIQTAAQEQYQQFIDRHGEVFEEEGTEYVRVHDPGDLPRFRTLDRQVRRTQLAASIIPRSFLVALVSQYDAYLGRLLRVLYSIKPELLNASDRSLSFSQLVEFKTVEAAKDYILEKEIESILRQSHAEQVKILENKFDVKLRVDLPVWPTFIEVTERRNLFVHSNGIVSSQYLRVCKEHDVRVEAAIEVGSVLDISKKYFDQAYKAIYEIGVKLAHTLWRKLLPAEREAADWYLNNASYELLREEKFYLTQILLDFAVSQKKFGSGAVRRSLIINRAQAYKWLGEKDKCASILAAEDWSDTGDQFQLGVAVLSENYERAAEIMRRIGPHGAVSKTDYRDWPLFKEFVEKEEFLKAFEEIFGIPFSEIQYAKTLPEDPGKELPQRPKEGLLEAAREEVDVKDESGEVPM